VIKSLTFVCKLSRWSAVTTSTDSSLLKAFRDERDTCFNVQWTDSEGKPSRHVTHFVDASVDWSCCYWSVLQLADYLTCILQIVLLGWLLIVLLISTSCSQHTGDSFCVACNLSLLSMPDHIHLSTCILAESYSDCLEVKMEYYQNCSVLDFVTQCSQSAAHIYEQFLQVQHIGFVTLGPLHLQEAQLWQRDRAKTDTFLIKVQRYSQNNAQNWIYGPPYGGIRSNICTLSIKFLAKRNLVAEFHRENVSFTRNT